MSNIPSPGQIYRHFKGNLYRIVTLAEDSETGNMLVIYQALYGRYKVYARPLSMFVERLDKKKYPDAAADFRFELQKELIEAPAFGQEDLQGAVSAVPDELSAGEEAAGPAARQESEVQIFSRQQDAAPEATVRISGTAEPEEETQENELNIDPLVLEFLDARTYEERLKILSRLRPRITDSMINVMSIAVDVEVGDGDLEERFDELRTCLSTRQRYESRGSRLR